MSGQTLSFIGREEEIAKISTFIQKPGRSYVVCIHGEGGIGKTRLLQEIREQQVKRDRTSSFVSIDFDNQNLRYPGNMYREIADTLDPETFTPFLRIQADYYAMKNVGVSNEGLEKKKMESKQAFIESLNKVAENKKVLLFFDTTDELTPDHDMWEELKDQLPHIKNVVMLLAGRNAREIGEFLQTSLQGKIEILDLKPLSEEDSRKFLERKQAQRYVEIDPNLAERLLILSHGRPILLDLAVEWTAREIPLKWLIETSLEEIKAAIDIRRKEFEKSLVSHIMDIRHPRDQLILLLSYFYPLNVTMISRLMKPQLGGQRAGELYNDIASYVFIKNLPNGYLTLHDEMRRMVNEYVWPEIDPDNEKRQWYSASVIQYVQDEIQKLTEYIKNRKTEQTELEERTGYGDEATLKLSLNIESLEQRLWELKEQQLKHTLITGNFDEGMKLFIKFFDEAARNSRYTLCRKLFDRVERYSEKLTSEQIIIRNIYQARLFFDDGRYKEARELCEKILERKGLSPDRQFDTLNRLANIKIRLGNVREGILDFQDALEISEKEQLPVRQITAYNALGWAYRLIGNLDRAQKHYRQAQTLCMEQGGPDKEELKEIYGFILNNLAFVLSYNHKNRQTALNLARLAVDHWKTIGHKIGLGTGHGVLGIANYRNVLLDEALEEFEKALKIFQALHHTDQLAQTYSWRGTVYRRKKQYENAKKELNKSLEIGLPNIKAMTLNRLARVYMFSQEWEKAEQLITESIDHARHIPDYIYWLNSVARLINIAAEKREYQRLDELQGLLKECISENENPNNNDLGIAYLGLAKLALTENNPEKINIVVDFLRKGVSLITEYDPYTSADIVTRLNFIERDFEELHIHPEIIQSVGKTLQEYAISKESEEVAYSAVIPAMYKWAKWKKGEKG